MMGLNSMAKTGMPLSRSIWSWNTFKIQDKKGYFNNYLVGSYTQGYVKMERTVWLFAGNLTTSSGGLWGAAVQQYVAYFKMSDGDGNLVIDLIPVVKDGVGYFYDKVSGRLLGNQGSGDFGIGPRTNYYEYEVEYLQSSGDLRIDTFYKPNQNTRVVIDFQAISNNHKYPRLFGCVAGETWDSVPAYQLDFEEYYYGNVLVKRGNESWNFTNKFGDANRHVIDLNRNILYIDGEEIFVGHTNAFQCTTDLTIFTMNTSYGIYRGSDILSYIFVGRLYSVKIYDDDVLVRDMIPVVANTGAGYMYDKVSKHLIRLGSCTVGPRVS